MCLKGGTRHRILDDATEVVVLVPIHERLVNADVGVSPDQDEGVRSQALEQDLPLGTEKHEYRRLRIR